MKSNKNRTTHHYSNSRKNFTLLKNTLCNNGSLVLSDKGLKESEYNVIKNFLSREWNWDKLFISKSLQRWIEMKLLTFEQFSFVFIENKNNDTISIGDVVELIDSGEKIDVIDVMQYDDFFIENNIKVNARTEYGDTVYLCSNNKWETNLTVRKYNERYIA